MVGGSGSQFGHHDRRIVEARDPGDDLVGRNAPAGADAYCADPDPARARVAAASSWSFCCFWNQAKSSSRSNFIVSGSVMNMA